MQLKDFVLVGVCTVLSVGCAKEPVVWADIHYSPVGTGSAPAGRVADSADHGEKVSPPIAVPDSKACVSSVRIARAGKSFFAVWWSAGTGSAPLLLTSRSDDGGEWTKPVAADTGDAGGAACDLPAPSIFADVINGYVHIAYFLPQKSGAGVFGIHSMDRGATFHATVPIVFGARPAATSVAAEGNRLALAYEDPNSARSRIFVALSGSAGHLYETKLPVSSENGTAVKPTVSLRGTKLEVRWTEMSQSDSTRTRQASRTGTWK